MQLDKELQGPFSYSSSLLVFVLILIILIIVFLVISHYLKNRQTKKPVVRREFRSLDIVKYKYIEKLNKLEDTVKANKISNRGAYLAVSRIIREFVKEITRIDVVKYTLSDIKKLKMDNLYELVKEYYEPEFSYDSVGDIIQSINKTRKEIHLWK